MTDDPDVQPDPFDVDGEPGDGELEDGPASGDVEPVDGGGASDGILSRAFDGNRDGPTVSDLKNEYGLGREMAIAGRGITRMATGGGVPPAFEIVVGSVLGALKLSEDGGPLDREPDAGAGNVGGEGLRR
jgi:hypothetical protein